MIKERANAIKVVITERKYFLIFLLTSVLFFGMLSFLTLATTAGYDIRVFIMMNGLQYTILTLSASIIISLLFGIWVSLLYRMKLKQIGFHEHSIGFFGSSAGIFSAGCPMCGSLVLGIFGAPLGLFFLPFKGLELKALSMAFLLISVFVMAKSLNCRTCDVHTMS